MASRGASSAGTARPTRVVHLQCNPSFFVKMWGGRVVEVNLDSRVTPDDVLVAADQSAGQEPRSSLLVQGHVARETKGGVSKSYFVPSVRWSFTPGERQHQ